MIIRTTRSRAGFLLDALLTLIGWVAFIYLFGTGILAILRGAAGGPEASLVPTFLPTLGTLSTYAAIALINAAILVGWAVYNHRRFAGLDRRKPIEPAGVQRIARSFSVTASEVIRLRAAKAVTVHHDPSGGLSASFLEHAACRHANV